jgi:hypothetical protein
MNGMKEGAGEDPFADDGADSTDDAPANPTDGDTSTESQPSSTEAGQVPADIPYKFRRDRPHEDRRQRPVYVRDETWDELDTKHDELENQLEEEIPKADIREAALLAGIRPDESVEDILRGWGFGMDV